MDEKSINPQMAKLVRGVSLALANAQALFREGQALYACNAFARALFLHQISLEECAKVEMLGCFAIMHLMGVPIELGNKRYYFTNHKTKNYTNAYMLPFNDAELKALDKADWRSSLDIFKERQASFHKESNDRKNAALYVDYVDDDVFVTPDDRITLEMVREIADRNHRFIELMRPKAELLSGWAAKGFDQVSKTLQMFRSRMEELREKLPNEPQKVLDIVLEEMVKAAKRA
ncbi:MAG: AbiV family abortive infection protein [Fibrobacterota bacterium]